MNILQFPSIRFSKKDFLSFNDAAKNWIHNQNYFFDRKKFFLLKTHNSLNKFDDNKFTTKNETKGAIYIVRDPRNVITSMCHHYSFSPDYALDKMLDSNASLSEKANNGDCSNFTYLGSWTEHYKSWRDNKEFRVLFIKYEDLQDKKIDTFNSIIKFVDELKGNKKTFDEKKFLNAINSTSFVNLKNKELNEGFEESFISKKGEKINFFNLGFKNKWQNSLPDDVISKANDCFKKELKELGYI
jgi:hypothetical protein